MTIAVRPLDPADRADGEAVAAVLRAAVPHLVTTGEAVAWEVTSSPPRARLCRLLAEEDGRVVGCAKTGLLLEAAGPGEGFAYVHVRPDAAGRGTGAALVRAAEAHLASAGAVRARTWVSDDDGYSPGFAERRGYRRSRPARFLHLDLAGAVLPALPDPLPAGVELRTGADFAADPRPYHEADVECIADEPSDVGPGTLPYEEWRRLYWERPDVDRELSSVVLVDGEVAAYSEAQTDGHGRYWSSMTGCRRAHRGRGLAGLAKLAALHRARAAGIRDAYTGNDAENAPMLAINTRLGYTAAARQWRYVKDLTPAAPGPR